MSGTAFFFEAANYLHYINTKLFVALRRTSEDLQLI